MKSRLIYLLISLALSFESFSIDLNQKINSCGYESIQMQNISTKHEVIEAEINGVFGLFVLDTGAIKTVIDQRLLSKYKLNKSLSTGSEKAAGAGGPISVHYYDIQSYGLNHWPIGVSNIGVTDLSAIINGLGLSTGVWVDGVIGQDLLLAHNGIINVSNQKLLFTPFKLTDTKKVKCFNELKKHLFVNGYNAIPLNQLNIDLTLLEVFINDSKAILVLDSGAGSSMLHHQSLSKFNFKTKDNIGERQSSGAGGSFKLQTNLLRSIKINNQKYQLKSISSLDLSAVINDFQEKVGIDIDGVLGQDVLETHNAIIDMGNNYLFLKRPFNNL